MARAGYISEEWQLNSKQTTTSSAYLEVPFWGIISPILSNIYLHEFDKFMATIIAKYSTPVCNGEVSIHNPEYTRLKKLDDKDVSPMTLDGAATRVEYNRYADNWIIGVSGSLELAKKINEEAKEFLSKTLDLELREENTAIYHLTSSSVRVKYLGFEIGCRPKPNTENPMNRMPFTRIQVYAPIAIIVEKLILHGFA